MKKLLFLLLAPVMLFAATQSTIPIRIVNQEAEAEYVIPEKVNGYFQLATKEDLQWFSDTTNHGGNGLNAMLVADIDFGGDHWIPIVAGNGTPTYTGTFDGKDFTISNLVLDTKWLSDYYNIQNSGFVGSLTGTVKNLTIDNITVYSEANGGMGSTNPNVIIEKAVSVGSAVGWLNGGTVDNVTVTGNMSAIGTGVAMGGIVGNAGGGKITNSTSSVTIRSHSDTSTVFIGGIVGYTKKTPTLKNDVWNGEIIENTGKGSSGGIAGYVYNGTVTIENVTFNHDGVESAVGKSCDKCKVSGDVDYGVYKIYTVNKKKICEIEGMYKQAVADGLFTVNDQVDSVVFNRKFNPGKYSTISFPFNVENANVTGARFYKLSDVVKEDGRYIVNIVEETDGLVANRPYIVITDGETISFSGSYTLAKSYPGTNTSVDEKWDLNAIYKYTTGADLGETRTRTYGFVARDTVIDGVSWASGQFTKVGAKGYIYPFRAFLEYTGPEGGMLAKSANLVAENAPETLDIRIVETAPEDEHTTAIVPFKLPAQKDFVKVNVEKNRIEIIHGGHRYKTNGKRIK